MPEVNVLFPEDIVASWKDLEEFAHKFAARRRVSSEAVFHLPEHSRAVEVWKQQQLAAVKESMWSSEE